MGTYLQLGVWVSVLSFAGYTGYTKILESADAAQDMGLLVAPSTAAIFLIVSFMTYTFVIQTKASSWRARDPRALRTWPTLTMTGWRSRTRVLPPATGRGSSSAPTFNWESGSPC